MKLTKFFIGVLGLMAFTACSSDEPVNPGTTNPGEEASFSDNYLSLSLQMPSAMGGRAEGGADNDKDKYDFNEEKESNVSNLFFFFFDDNDNVVDIQKVDPKFTYDPNENKNPFVTSFGTSEVRLKSGLNYKKVAVVLNSNVTSASSYRTEITNLSDLEARVGTYLDQVNKAGDGSMQVMSNSVYFDMTDRTVKPTQDKKVILVPITEKNIYTSAEKSKMEEDGLAIPTGKEAVQIFVERVLAKVTVESTLNMDDFYASEENDGGKITIYDNVNLTTKTVTLQPVIKGVSLNVLTKQANLIKPILINSVGYGLGSGDGYKDFQWNDPLNKRSYWATTEETTSNDLEYFSWNQVLGKNVKEGNISKFTQYIYPNTQAYLPTADNEINSNNTKVMVIAQLMAKNADGTLENIDIVRYGGDYMEASNLTALSANNVNAAVRNINWQETSLELSEQEYTIVNTVVNNAFVEGTTTDMYEIKILNSIPAAADFEAKIVKSDKFSYTLTVNKALFDDYADDELHAILDNEETLNALLNKAKVKIDAVIDEILGSMNDHRILYWKDGMTYYYTTIKQQGFYGLVGGGTANYLNGVVRNHYYQISIDGIYGLGTPVIEPGRPIDPERPEVERPNYLKATINILPWRVVKNSATIH
ncbi:MAG: Mfa1 family fimbria major subunit [Paramuribaculum sp.]|nr:Mfa1 family fimbria major subunit [Paramuribaculum sp.]